MKTFKAYVSEDIDPSILAKSAEVDIRNPDVLENVNVLLDGVSVESFPTPYIGLERVRKVLAYFKIFIPGGQFLSGASGHEIIPIEQFGFKTGKTDQGTWVERGEVAKDHTISAAGSEPIHRRDIPDEVDEGGSERRSSNYFLHVEWDSDNDGMFRIHASIRDEMDTVDEDGDLNEGKKDGDIPETDKEHYKPLDKKKKDAEKDKGAKDKIRDYNAKHRGGSVVKEGRGFKPDRQQMRRYIQKAKDKDEVSNHKFSPKKQIPKNDLPPDDPPKKKDYLGYGPKYDDDKKDDNKKKLEEAPNDMMKRFKTAKDMIHADSVGKDKTGHHVFRQEFFYRHGGTSQNFANHVSNELTKAGVPHDVVDHGEHWAPFRGGASVKSSSHWWAKVKLKDNKEALDEKVADVDHAANASQYMRLSKRFSDKGMLGVSKAYQKQATAHQKALGKEKDKSKRKDLNEISKEVLRKSRRNAFANSKKAEDKPVGSDKKGSFMDKKLKKKKAPSERDPKNFLATGNYK